MGNPTYVVNKCICKPPDKTVYELEGLTPIRTMLIVRAKVIG